jgi:hypothetical protein
MNHTKVILFCTHAFVFVLGGETYRYQIESHTPSQKVEIVSPATVCTKYDFSGPNNSKYCFQWKRKVGA